MFKGRGLIGLLSFEEQFCIAKVKDNKILHDDSKKN